jgi:hypothetical protein
MLEVGVNRFGSQAAVDASGRQVRSTRDDRHTIHAGLLRLRAKLGRQSPYLARRCPRIKRRDRPFARPGRRSWSFCNAQLLELRSLLSRLPRCRIAADLGLQFPEIDEDVGLAS